MVEEIIVDIRATTTTGAVSENSAGEVVDALNITSNQPHRFAIGSDSSPSANNATSNSEVGGDLFSLESSSTPSTGTIILEENTKSCVSDGGGGAAMKTEGSSDKIAEELTNRLLILEGSQNFDCANITATTPQHQHASTNSVKTSGSNSASNSPSRRHPGAIGIAERSSKTGLSLCLNPTIISGNCSASGNTVEELSSAATGGVVTGGTLAAGNGQDNDLQQIPCNNTSAGVSKSASLNLKSSSGTAACATPSKTLARSMNANLNEQEEQVTQQTQLKL